MLYAVPDWGIPLHVLDNAHKLSVVCRRTALKVRSVFRTRTDDMAFLVSEKMPIDIFADEMMSIYNARTISPLPQAKKKIERENSISK